MDLELGLRQDPSSSWVAAANPQPVTPRSVASRYPATGTRRRDRQAPVRARRPRVPHPLPASPCRVRLLTGWGRREAGALHPRGPLGLLGALSFNQRIFRQLQESSHREMAKRPRRGGRVCGAQRPGPGAQRLSRAARRLRALGGRQRALLGPGLPVIGHERLHAEGQERRRRFGLGPLLLRAHGGGRRGRGAGRALARASPPRLAEGRVLHFDTEWQRSHISSRGHAEPGPPPAAAQASHQAWASGGLGAPGALAGRALRACASRRSRRPALGRWGAGALGLAPCRRRRRRLAQAELP